MILDQAVLTFLTKTEPLYIHLAVANSEVRPFSIRGFGVKVSESKDRLSVFILKAQAEKILNYLSNNRSVATLFTDGFSNESYQIKGEFVELKQIDESENEILHLYRNGSLKLFPPMYSKFPLSSEICEVVTFNVNEVFIQTPGPYAGKKYQKGGSDFDS
ncbi:hypothetical protein [Neobacillus sp. LXY-1]|uniref:hypothetical protein n=1 Tax=Neobacillus sp. LXY-1 TaxID=3379133 RepID=UPI003EDF8201